MTRNSGRPAVVTVTYNSADVVPDFLTALDSAAAGPVDLVIVDNGSTDGTLELIEARAAGATVIRSPRNGGFAAGVNLGLAATHWSAPALVINPDVRLHPGALDALCAAARADPAVGIVVPQLRDDQGRLLYSLRRDPSALRVLGEALLGGTRAGRLGVGEMIAVPHRYEQPGTADWASGACMLLTAECRARVGAWDEQYFLYSEETDYALRTRDHGLVLHYQPRAVATHRGGDAHRSPELFSLLMVNRWRLHRRRHGPIAATAFRAALIIDMAPRALAGRAPARAALRSLLRAEPDRAGLVPRAA